MGFFEAVGSVLSKYFTFSGRALRSEYWFWALFYMLGAIPVSMAAGLGVTGPYAIYGLAILIPTLAVTARRLHDTNLSGWWSLITIIPFAWLILLYWLVKKGDPGDNRFGMPPYGSKSGNSTAAQAARSRQEPSSSSSSNEPNSSAAIPSEPSASAAIPNEPSSRDERSRQDSQSTASPSKPRSTKPEDIFFDNRRKPIKKNPPDEPIKNESNEETTPKEPSSEVDDIFFDNRRKK